MQGAPIKCALYYMCSLECFPVSLGKEIVGIYLLSFVEIWHFSRLALIL